MIAFATVAAVCSGVLLVTPPAVADDDVLVPKADYRVFAVDSEADAWPAPPALDGTAAGAFDGDYTSQWVSRYSESKPFPHWIVIDLQRTVEVSALNYSIRPTQAAVAAKDVRVYVTDDATVAARKPSDTNIDAWGAPAGTAARAVT